MWAAALKGFAVALSFGGVSPAVEDCTPPDCCKELFCPPPGGKGGVVYKYDPGGSLGTKYDRAPVGGDQYFSPFDHDYHYYAPDDRRVTE